MTTADIAGRDTVKTCQRYKLRGTLYNKEPKVLFALAWRQSVELMAQSRYILGEISITTVLSGKSFINSDLNSLSFYPGSRRRNVSNARSAEGIAIYKTEVLT